MSSIAIVAVFFVTWWLVLFAVMPWGMRTQDEEGDVVLGTPRSAPVKPRLLRKVIGTTIVATVVVGALWIAVDVYGLSVWSVADWIDLRQ